MSPASTDGSRCWTDGCVTHAANQSSFELRISRATRPSGRGCRSALMAPKSWRIRSISSKLTQLAVSFLSSSARILCARRMSFSARTSSSLVPAVDLERFESLRYLRTGSVLLSLLVWERASLRSCCRSSADLSSASLTSTRTIDAERCQSTSSIASLAVGAPPPAVKAPPLVPALFQAAYLTLNAGASNSPSERLGRQDSGLELPMLPT
mmetsp:Transcript_4828/g.11726  ORF Transcript_4828/g.11726 Transcript_4828/m.11726 type:complete len:210 (+) Transcript_4828:554-1183(+)